MIHVIISFAFCLLLAVLCAASIFRNFFSQYKMSSNGFVTILVLILAVAALLYALGGAIGAAYYQDAIIQLKTNPGLSSQEIENLKQAVAEGPWGIYQYIIKGYAFYAAHFSLIKLIQWRMNNKIKRNSEKGWKSLK